MGLRVPAFVYGSLLGLAILSLWRGTPKRMAILGAVCGCAATLGLWKLSVGFFWWYPVAALITVIVGRIGASKAR